MGIKEIKEIKKVLIVVPVRLNSSRLPNKVIADIGGKPMLTRVLEQCKKALKKNNIILCTDSDVLVDIAKNLGIKSLVTKKNCKSGSERISSVYKDLLGIAWSTDFLGDEQNHNNFEEKKKQTLIINVQGDQPFLDPKVIQEMIDVCFKKEQIPDVITPIYKLNKSEIHNPAVVKTLLNQNMQAIYFSRSALPYIRDERKEDWHLHYNYWGHVGIYGFRGDIISKWNQFPNSKLEKLENLEQLRLVDAGVKIDTFKVNGKFLSIDTKEQLEIARKIVSQDSGNTN